MECQLGAGTVVEFDNLAPERIEALIPRTDDVKKGALQNGIHHCMFFHSSLMLTKDNAC